MPMRSILPPACGLVLVLALLLSLASLPLAAQENTGPLAAEEVQGILTIPDTAAFMAKIDELKAGNRVNAQHYYELRLFRAWQARDLAVLRELATRAQMAAVEYQVADSLFFSTEDQKESFLALLQAMIAAEDGNEPGVRARLMESIWLFPDHAEMAAELIRDFRRKQAMKDLAIPVTTKFAQSTGGEITLAQLAEGQKGVLLSFWAPWAEPSMKLLPGLAGKAADLRPKGIVVAGVCTENNAPKAEAIRQEQKLQIPWLIEPTGQPLVNALQIDSLPRAALLSPAGKVLFNGHLEDPALTEALKGLGITP